MGCGGGGVWVPTTAQAPPPPPVSFVSPLSFANSATSPSTWPCGTCAPPVRGHGGDTHTHACAGRGMGAHGGCTRMCGRRERTWAMHTCVAAPTGWRGGGGTGRAHDAKHAWGVHTHVGVHTRVCVHLYTYVGAPPRCWGGGAGRACDGAEVWGGRTHVWGCDMHVCGGLTRVCWAGQAPRHGRSRTPPATPSPGSSSSSPAPTTPTRWGGAPLGGDTALGGQFGGGGGGISWGRDWHCWAGGSITLGGGCWGGEQPSGGAPGGGHSGMGGGG